MKTIKTLLIRFNNELTQREVSQFRGAIIKKLDKPDVLFHHHIVDENKFRNKYPLIQYKTINQKAALFCIEDGVESVQQFLNLDEWELQIGDKTVNIEIDYLKVNKFTIQAWDKYFSYKIYNWLALNNDNYKEHSKAKTEKDKIYILEKVLRGNILSFGKGIDCFFEHEVKVRIEHITKEKVLHYKDLKLHGIDAIVNTNVFLPNYIGLGKGSSMGFGVIKTINDKNIKKNGQ